MSFELGFHDVPLSLKWRIIKWLFSYRWKIYPLARMIVIRISVISRTCVFSLVSRGYSALLAGRRGGRPGDRTQGADQAGLGGEAVPGGLAGVHDLRQVAKDRVGEPMAAQIMPDALDRIEFRAVGRQGQ